MVKFQVSTSHKRYLKGKRIYKHKRVFLTVPASLLKTIEPHLGEQLQAYAISEGGRLEIRYTNHKTTKLPHKI